MTRETAHIFLAIVAAAFVGACNKSDATQSDSAAQPSEPANGAASSTAAPAPQPVATAKLVATVLKPYETCRALLAADKVVGIADCATAMSAAAKVVAKTGPDATRGHSAAIAAAAQLLAEENGGDLERARERFGAVSEPVVALLAAVPEAAKDYRVYECPMAKGYNRWAQAQGEMANPYMGTKMPACGSETHDHHQGMDDHHRGMDDHHPTHGDGSTGDSTDEAEMHHEGH